jgi:hypothetical protein
VKRKSSKAASDQAELDPELLALIKTTPGGGLSRDILDNAFWRGDHEPDDAWVAALDQLDRLGDKRPLTTLLRSDFKMTPKVRLYLADLVERGVRSPRGHPRVPAYTLSAADAMLLQARDRARAYVENGLLVKDAIAQAAREFELDESKVANALRGKRGSLRRRLKNL